MSRRPTKSTSTPSSPASSSVSSTSKTYPRPPPLSTLRALNLADYITLLNGFSGVMSILHSMQALLPPTQLSSTSSGKFSFSDKDLGVSPETKHLWWALAWIPLGLLFDFMDGRVARMRGKGAGSLLGQELDSLADLISFGVAPAVAAFALGFRTEVDKIVLVFFVLCGLLRLARFNVSTGDVPKDAKGKALYFEGAPIPTSLAIVAGMAVCLGQGWVGGEVLGGVLGRGEWWEIHALSAVFVGWGFMMTSRRLRVPKP